ncbi:MAG: hypothetical protein F9K32_17605 [Desulfobulbaceae bacterium]|nr:MAG: hypothetical protein F9K32_17605 [Desulfobulbaceae bacterium]
MASECGANADPVSKKPFGQLVVDEKRHYDLCDNEIASLRRFGKEYLALRSIEGSATRRARGGAAANKPAEHRFPLQGVLHLGDAFFCAVSVALVGVMCIDVTGIPPARE